MPPSDDFAFVEPRPTVEIHLPDGRVISGPRGASAASFLEPIRDQLKAPLVGAVINGELRELTYQIRHGRPRPACDNAR